MPRSHNYDDVFVRQRSAWSDSFSVEREGSRESWLNQVEIYSMRLVRRGQVLRLRVIASSIYSSHISEEERRRHGDGRSLSGRRRRSRTCCWPASGPR